MFVDAQGFTCNAWYTQDCTQMVFGENGEIVYTAAEVKEVEEVNMSNVSVASLLGDDLDRNFVKLYYFEFLELIMRC